LRLERYVRLVIQDAVLYIASDPESLSVTYVSP
jgi:hypothetical protein